MEYTNILKNSVNSSFGFHFYNTNNYPQIAFGFFKDETQITFVNTCRGYMMERLAQMMCMSKKELETKSHIILGEDDYSGVTVTASKAAHISQKTDIVLNLLNRLDKKLGFKPTVICKVDVNNENFNTYKVYMDSRWFHAPFLVSLFTLSIRYVAVFHKKSNSLKKTFDYIKKCYQEGFGENERLYHAQMRGSDNNDFNNSRPFIDKILKHGIEPFFFPKRKDNYIKARIRAHYFGVNGLASGYGGWHNYANTKQYKHAHRFKDAKEITSFIRKFKREQKKAKEKAALKLKKSKKRLNKQLAMK